MPNGFVKCHKARISTNAIEERVLVNYYLIIPTHGKVVDKYDKGKGIA